MVEISSDDYHDFVFRNGALLGEFEQMYRKSTTIPWHQDRDAERPDCRIAIEILRASAPYGEVLELCSGLGYFAAFVSEQIALNSLTGSDVSPTAVSKAQVLFPNISFKTLNICHELEEQNWSDREFDLVIIRASFWYLFPEMATVIKNIRQLVRPGGYLFVSQNFPPLDSEFIGKAVIPTPESLMSYFAEHFCFRAVNHFDDRMAKGGNDFWLMFLAQRTA